MVSRPRLFLRVLGERTDAFLLGVPLGRSSPVFGFSRSGPTCTQGGVSAGSAVSLHSAAARLCMVNEIAFARTDLGRVSSPEPGPEPGDG